MDSKNDPHMAVLNWAQKHGYHSFDSVTVQPWSSVWRVKSPSGVPHILKQIVRPASTNLGFLKTLSMVFPETCARIAHFDAAQGFFVFEFVKPGAHSAGPVQAAGQLLEDYGKIQARGAELQAKLTDIPPLQAWAVYKQVADLLSGANPRAPGNVFDTLPADQRSILHAALQEYEPVFSTLAQTIEKARATVNHTDLRLDNAILRADGRFCILDWDDAIFSAPGWSLNMQFSGCLRVHAVLNQPALYADQTVKDRDLAVMRRYVAALKSTQLYSNDDLQKLLPATAAFGILKYAADMAPYDISAPATQLAVRATIQRRFTDLTQFLRINARNMGYAPKSTAPKSTAPKGNGMTVQFTAFPEITVAADSAETASNQMQQTADVAAQTFLENGALLVRNCFSQTFIRSCFRSFISKQDQHFADMNAGRALRVGNRRFMISLETEGVFGSADLLAPPALMAIFDRLLGPNFVLGSLTAVVALQKSDPQRWHRDNDVLFQEAPGLKVPPFSIALLIPLIPLTEQTGATEIVPGSHVDLHDQRENPPIARPKLSLGDCYMMDSRLMHRGMANVSEGARPVLSLVYTRPWYKDYQNFNKQPALTVSAQTLAAFPERRRPLIAWALKHEG